MKDLFNIASAHLSDTDICRDYSYNPPRQKQDSIIRGSIARTWG